LKKHYALHFQSTAWSTSSMGSSLPNGMREPPSEIIERPDLRQERENRPLLQAFAFGIPHFPFARAAY
jgi:hypothetical protein